MRQILLTFSVFIFINCNAQEYNLDSIIVDTSISDYYLKPYTHKIDSMDFELDSLNSLFDVNNYYDTEVIVDKYLGEKLIILSLFRSRYGEVYTIRVAENLPSDHYRIENRFEVYRIARNGIMHGTDPTYFPRKLIAESTDCSIQEVKYFPNLKYDLRLKNENILVYKKREINITLGKGCQTTDEFLTEIRLDKIYSQGPMRGNGNYSGLKYYCPCK